MHCKLSDHSEVLASCGHLYDIWNQTFADEQLDIHSLAADLGCLHRCSQYHCA